MFMSFLILISYSYYIHINKDKFEKIIDLFFIFLQINNLINYLYFKVKFHFELFNFTLS